MARDAQLQAETDAALALTVVSASKGLEERSHPERPLVRREAAFELLRLRGYTSPELRVNNATGSYVGGGIVNPFEGSFTNDTIDYRFRYPTGGVLWDDTYVLKSDGTTAPA